MSGGEWQAGQKVILRRVNRPGEDRWVVIDKVARKYLTVQVYGRDYLFHIDTGYEKADYAASLRVLTRETAEAEDRQIAARMRLRELGVDLSKMAWRLPAEAMEEIVRIIERAYA